MLTILTSIASSMLFVSPPPPPPPAPEVAQEQFGAYHGTQLWPAWRNWINRQTVELLDDTYHVAGLREGYFETETGPKMTSSTGYWTEFRQASYLRLCSRADTQICEWVYRSARINGRDDVFHDLAVEFFDGAALAQELSERNIPADQLNGVDFSLFGELRNSLLEHVEVNRISETECPGVSRWRERLAEEPPLDLSGQAVHADTPPPPPMPIHIRTLIEIPVSAYFGANVTVQIDGVRNPAVMDVWANITRDIGACQQGD